MWPTRQAGENTQARSRPPRPRQVKWENQRRRRAAWASHPEALAAEPATSESPCATESASHPREVRKEPRGVGGRETRTESKGGGGFAPPPRSGGMGAFISGPRPQQGREVPSTAEAGTPDSKKSRWRRTCRSLTRGTSPRGKCSGSPVTSGSHAARGVDPLTFNSRNPRGAKGDARGLTLDPLSRAPSRAGAPVSQAAPSPPKRGKAWRVSIHLLLRSEGGTCYRRHGP